MKRKILFFIILIISLQSALGWGCDNEHCKVSANSIYMTNLAVNRYPGNEDYASVYYVLDLNYIGGAVSPFSLGNIGEDWYTYTFNNWYSSKYIDLSQEINGYVGFYYEIQPIDPELNYLCAPIDRSNEVHQAICRQYYLDGEDCTGLMGGGICEWDINNDFKSVNYLGLPFYIKGCQIDCDYTGDTNTCEPDGEITDYFDYSSGSEGYGIINLNGNEYTGATYSELVATPGYLYGIGRVRTSINYNCGWDDDSDQHNVAISCDLVPNLAYRHDSPLDKDWTFEDIIPAKFEGINKIEGGATDCMSFSVNMTDDTFNPYNTTVNDMNDYLGINPDDISGSSGAVNQINDAIYSSTGTHSIVNQIKSNNELIEMTNRLSWQRSIVSVIDTLATMIILVYYVFVISVMIALLLFDLPHTFKLMLDVLRKATQFSKKI